MPNPIDNSINRRALLKTLAGVTSLGVISGCIDQPGLASGTPWGFTDSTQEAGLNYTATNTGLGNGNSGVYVSDYNNDGWPDVLAIGGENPVLYRNNQGVFEETNEIPELEITTQGALFFDSNNNGWDDLLLLPRNGFPVFLENNEGSFQEVDKGFNDELGVAVGATAADSNNNGYLDVFIIQYGDWAEGSPEGFHHPEGGVVEEDNGAPNLLYRNTGDDFELATDSGIEKERWSLATSFVDLTGDGYPDIHVANDFNTDILYVNNGDGTFEEKVINEATARNGMSSLVADFNKDGKLDIFETNIYFPLNDEDISEARIERLERYASFMLRSKRIDGNTLLINQGNGEFIDMAEEFNVWDGGWGWASTYTDLDNDGEKELFHETQHVFRVDPNEPHYTYPMMWRRDEDAFTKLDTQSLGFQELDARGLAVLDYDRDGDMDLIVSTVGGEFTVYENKADELDDANYLQVKVTWENPNREAIGASVWATNNGETELSVQTQEVDYQSQKERLFHFGLGSSESMDELKVEWPNGDELTLSDIPGNQRITITPDGILDN